MCFHQRNNSNNFLKSNRNITVAYSSLLLEQAGYKSIQEIAGQIAEVQVSGA